MTRNVTVTFANGQQHIYQNVPDEVTPDQINQRASAEFGVPVFNIDGGNPPPSGAKSFGKAAVEGVLPSISGTVGAGLAENALLAGATLLAPEATVPIWLMRGAGLLGGIGTGIATYEAQKMGLEKAPEFAKATGFDKATREREIQAHPYLSAAGMMAPGFGLATPKFNFGNAVNAQGQSLRNVALTRAAQSFGIGAAVQLGSQLYYNGGDFSKLEYGPALLAAGIGALQNNPTRFGRALMPDNVSQQYDFSQDWRSRQAGTTPPPGGAAPGAPRGLFGPEPPPPNRPAGPFSPLGEPPVPTTGPGPTPPGAAPPSVFTEGPQPPSGGPVVPTPPAPPTPPSGGPVVPTPPAPPVPPPNVDPDTGEVIKPPSERTEAEAGLSTPPKNIPTWDNLPIRGSITLYRADNFGLQDGAEWWTTNPEKTKTGGSVTRITLPVDAVTGNATVGKGGLDEFVFPELKPNELVNEGVNNVFNEPSRNLGQQRLDFDTPPTETPSAGTPPAETPPAGTPPAGTPPAGTPPAVTEPPPAPQTLLERIRAKGRTKNEVAGRPARKGALRYELTYNNSLPPYRNFPRITPEAAATAEKNVLVSLAQGTFYDVGAFADSRSLAFANRLVRAGKAAKVYHTDSAGENKVYLASLEKAEKLKSELVAKDAGSKVRVVTGPQAFDYYETPGDLTVETPPAVTETPPAVTETRFQRAKLPKGRLGIGKFTRGYGEITRQPVFFRSVPAEVLAADKNKLLDSAKNPYPLLPFNPHENRDQFNELAKVAQALGIPEPKIKDKKGKVIKYPDFNERNQHINSPEYKAFKQEVFNRYHHAVNALLKSGELSIVYANNYQGNPDKYFFPAVVKTSLAEKVKADYLKNETKSYNESNTGASRKETTELRKNRPNRASVRVVTYTDAYADRSNQVTPAADGRTWGRPINESGNGEPEVVFRKVIGEYKNEGWPSITISIGRDADGQWTWATHIKRVDVTGENGGHWLTTLDWEQSKTSKTERKAVSEADAFYKAREEALTELKVWGRYYAKVKDWVEWLNSLTLEDGVRPSKAVEEKPKGGYTPPEKPIYKPEPTPADRIEKDDAVTMAEASGLYPDVEDPFYRYGSIFYQTYPEHMQYDFPTGVNPAQLQIAERIARDEQLVTQDYAIPPTSKQPKAARINDASATSHPWWDEYRAHKALAASRIYNSIGRLLDSGKLVWLHVPYEFNFEHSGTHLVRPEHFAELKEYAEKAIQELQAGAKRPTETTDSRAAENNYDRAVEFVVSKGKVSASALQKELGIGWSTAKKLIEQMEKEGVVSKADDEGKRTVLKEREAKTPTAPQTDEDVALQLFREYGPFSPSLSFRLDIMFGGTPYSGGLLPRTEAAIKAVVDSGKVREVAVGPDRVPVMMPAEFADRYEKYYAGKMDEAEELAYEEDLVLALINSNRDTFANLSFKSDDPRHPYSTDLPKYLQTKSVYVTGATARITGTYAEDRLMDKGLIRRNPLTGKGVVTAAFADNLKEWYAEKLADKKTKAASKRTERAVHDPLRQQALDHIAKNGAALSPLQKALGIGYARAKTIVESLEKTGNLSAPDESGKRTVLNPDATSRDALETGRLARWEEVKNKYESSNGERGFSSILTELDIGLAKNVFIAGEDGRFKKVIESAPTVDEGRLRLIRLIADNTGVSQSDAEKLVNAYMRVSGDYDRADTPQLPEGTRSAQRDGYEIKQIAKLEGLAVGSPERNNAVDEIYIDITFHYWGDQDGTLEYYLNNRTKLTRDDMANNLAARYNLSPPEALRVMTAYDRVEELFPADQSDDKPSSPAVTGPLQEGDIVSVGSMRGTVIGVEGDYIKFYPENAKNPKAYQRVAMKSAKLLERQDPTILSAKSEVPQSRQGTYGIGGEAMLAMLGTQEYNGNKASVAIKESLQNSFDAIKEAVYNGVYPYGKITIILDANARTVTVTDNAMGMSPEIVDKAYFTVAGTEKGNLPMNQRSGGFGIAKVQLQTSMDSVTLDTVRDGVRTRTTATPLQIAAAVNGNTKESYRLEYSKAPKSEHGTTVTYKVPEKYYDRNGNPSDEWFPYDGDSVRSLRNPMIGPVEVTLISRPTWGGEEVTVWPMGINFDTNKMPLYTTIQFPDWGSADIYISVDREKYPRHSVLSAGIWQFDLYPKFEVGKDEYFPYNVIVNIKSEVPAQSPFYPITKTREGFAASVENDVKALRTYIQRLGRSIEAADLKETFKNIVTMPRIELGEGIDQTKLKKSFDRPAISGGSSFTGTKGTGAPPETRTVVIRGGELETTGGGTPTAKKRKQSEAVADKAIPSQEESMITIEQDPRLPTFHNNTNVDFIAVGEPFGNPQQFFAELGTLMVEMKELMAKAAEDDYSFTAYSAYSPENLFFAGVAIDKTYAGVHIKVPYKAVYINPFSEFGATSLFGVRSSLYETMKHELAHIGNMEHGVSHNQHMKKIGIYLADTGMEDYFRDKLLDVLQRHESTFAAMKEVYDKSTTVNVAKSLEDYGKNAAESPIGGASGGRGDASRTVQAGGESGDGGRLVAFSRRPQEGPDGGGGGGDDGLTPPTPEERASSMERRIAAKSKTREDREKINIRRALFNAQQRYDAFVSQLKTDIQNIWNPSKELLTQMENVPGRLIEYGDNANNLYQIQSRMDSMADYYSTAYVHPIVNELMNGISYYAKGKGISYRLAADTISEYLIARHADERREEYFVRYRPLKNTNVRQADGRMINPATARSNLYRQAAFIAGNPGHGTREERIAKLREISAQLRRIVLDNRNVDPMGASPHPLRPATSSGELRPMPTNWKDLLYAPADDTHPDNTATTRDLIHRDLQDPDIGPILRKIFNDVKRMNEVSKQLRRLGGFWSDHVDEITEGLYDFKNYIPLKSRLGDLDPIDLEGTRNFGHVAGFTQGMEGGRHIVENTLFQLMFDAYRGAHIASRAGITLRVKNLIDQKHVAGKHVTNISAGERFLVPDLRAAHPEAMGGDKIYHMLPDGTAMVYQLDNEPILNGLRRPYDEAGIVQRAAAYITSMISRNLTLWNPLFAPFNFWKDARSAGHILPLEYEGEIGKYDYQLSVLQNVMSGKGFTAFKVARLYRTGRHEELAAFVAQNPFARSALEYIRRGGPSTHAMIIRADEGYRALARNVDPNTYQRARDFLERYARAWNDSWDLTARVTAFDIIRQIEMQKGKPEQVANELAAYRAKELSNLSLYGAKSRWLASLYTFFRPSATTVVRTFEALEPAWRNTEKMVDKSLPPDQRANEEARERVREKMNRKKSVVRALIKSLIGLGMLEYAAAFLMSDKDEQGRNRVAMDDKGMAVRGARFAIPGTERFFNVPHGFGTGNFVALGYQLAALLNPADKQDIGSFSTNVVRIAGDLFSPISPSNIDAKKDPFAFLLDSITPSALRPGLELAMNKNSMGNPIFNTHASKYAESQTGGRTVPQIWKEVADYAYRHFGVDIPPNILNYLASNYINGMTTMMSMATEVGMQVASLLSGGAHGKTIDPKAIVGSFVGNEVNIDSDEYASVKMQIDKLSQKLNTAELDADLKGRQLERDPLAQAAVSAFNKNLGRIREIERRMKEIRVNPYLPINTKNALLKANQDQLDLQKRLAIMAVEPLGIEP